MKVTKVEALKAALEGRIVKTPCGNSVVFEQGRFQYCHSLLEIDLKNIGNKDWEIVKEPVKWSHETIWVGDLPSSYSEFKERRIKGDSSTSTKIRVTVEEITD